MEKILILYTEYAPYLHACLVKFTRLFDYEVHVVRYPLDPNAPFDFSKEKRIFFHERNTLNREKLMRLYRELDPVCIIVAGWIDKDYNSILPKIKRLKKPVICVMDNQWTGSLKQKLFLKIGRFFIHRRYSKIWVPGLFQFEYLRRAGIPPKAIMTGYYSADSDLFLERYKAPSQIPKRIVYVGRLLDIKGTPTLLKAIELLNDSEKTDWQFLIIGKGIYEEEVKALSSRYPNVVHKPFMQPAELARETADGGVFVLPSNYDAWGVAVHELAILGFPLILSSMVGSRNYFVSPGYNGYVFESRNPHSLASVFKKVISLDDDTLKRMSERSHILGKTINTESWACRLKESIDEFYGK